MGLRRACGHRNRRHAACTAQPKSVTMVICANPHVFESLSRFTAVAMRDWYRFGEVATSFI